MAESGWDLWEPIWDTARQVVSASAAVGAIGYQVRRTLRQLNPGRRVHREMRTQFPNRLVKGAVMQLEQVYSDIRTTLDACFDVDELRLRLLSLKEVGVADSRAQKMKLWDEIFYRQMASLVATALITSITTNAVLVELTLNWIYKAQRTEEASKQNEQAGGGVRGYLVGSLVAAVLPTSTSLGAETYEFFPGPILSRVVERAQSICTVCLDSLKSSAQDDGNFSCTQFISAEKLIAILKKTLRTACERIDFAALMVNFEVEEEPSESGEKQGKIEDEIVYPAQVVEATSSGGPSEGDVSTIVDGSECNISDANVSDSIPSQTSRIDDEVDLAEITASRAFYALVSSYALHRLVSCGATTEQFSQILIGCKNYKQDTQTAPLLQIISSQGLKDIYCDLVKVPLDLPTSSLRYANALFAANVNHFD